MNLRPISKVYREMKEQGHHINRNDLYALAREGAIPLIKGKTTVEAVLKALLTRLGTPLPERPEDQPRRNGCSARESTPKRGQRSGARSNGQHQHVATGK